MSLTKAEEPSSAALATTVHQDLAAEQQAARDRARAVQRRWTIAQIAIRVVSLAVVLSAWEYLGRNTNPILFTYPTAVAAAAAKMIASGELWKYLSQSLIVLFAGLGLATVFGIALGLIMARFWVVDHVKARIAERGVLRTIVPLIYSTFFRRYRNRELARRYAALRDLPERSLGRAYVAYIDANKFGLPGERGAISDLIVPHDLAHVLGDYGTEPAEEVLVASFSAGHRVKDPFAFLMFVMLQFHLGLRVTPGAKAERGYFDPAHVLAAIARGAELNIDLTARWDYWTDLAAPLETVRRRYNVSPRMPRAATRAA